MSTEVPHKGVFRKHFSGMWFSNKYGQFHNKSPSFSQLFTMTSAIFQSAGGAPGPG